jgi:catechol 2,3-dioxygenase-like lactoylglutathione lyase family enzyme
MSVSNASDTGNAGPTRVVARRINHVSINAVDIEAAGRFYEDLLGMERLPTPNFGFPVYWLRLGAVQLHLFQAEAPSSGNHHVAFEVDDFEAAFRRLAELDLFDREGFFSRMYEMPDGAVQMYFRDPSGNLIEIDHPDLSQLDQSLFANRLVRLDTLFEQTDENRRGTLFVPANES